jgi:hypothetical protein
LKALRAGYWHCTDLEIRGWRWDSGVYRHLEQMVMIIRLSGCVMDCGRHGRPEQIQLLSGEERARWHSNALSYEDPSNRDSEMRWSGDDFCYSDANHNRKLLFSCCF